MSEKASDLAISIIANKLRVNTLRMIHRARASHIGSCFSAAEILACLYWDTLLINPMLPNDPSRDRFVLSKGHAAAILYSALSERGFFPVEDLESYCQDGTTLTGHVNNSVPGVEVSTGSLGHGLPVGCGLALAAKRDGSAWRTFVLVSDGELDEGSNWEAILFAPFHKLSNLVLIIDYNKIQSFGSVSEVLELNPLADKLRAFHWNVTELDGHDIPALRVALNVISAESDIPTAILAHTVKGKGVSFMEESLLWHYKSPSNEQFLAALKELEGRQ